MVQTGRMAGDRQVYPGMGAVVSLFRGYDAGYKGLVPPYIVLTELQGRFSEAGFLGIRYKPFATGGDPAQTALPGRRRGGPGHLRPAAARPPRTAGEAQHPGPRGGRRRPPGRAPRRRQSGLRPDPRRCRQSVRPRRKRKTTLRDRYGRNTFGQSCLLARRLVERGVPYVTINNKGWDTHKENFQAMRRKLPELDKGLATLLAGPGRARPAGAAPSSGAAASSAARPRCSGKRPGTAGAGIMARCFRRWWPAAASRAATSSARPTPRAKTSRIGPSIPATCWAACTNCWASTPRPPCRIRWAWRPTSPPPPAEGVPSAGRLREIM